MNSSVSSPVCFLRWSIQKVSQNLYAVSATVDGSKYDFVGNFKTVREAQKACRRYVADLLHHSFSYGPLSGTWISRHLFRLRGIFSHSPFNRFKMSLRARRWPRPWFFFANVLYTTGRTPRLLCRESPRSIIQSVALSLGCPFKFFRVPIWHVFSSSLWCPRFWSAKRGDTSWCLIRRFFFSLGELLVER